MHLSEEGTMEVVEVVPMEEKGGTFLHEGEWNKWTNLGETYFKW